MVNLTRVGTSSLVASAISTAVATVSSTIGQNVLSIGILGGAGFGLVQGAISRVAYDFLYVKPNKGAKSDDTARMFKSEIIGSTAACILAYGAASLGITSAPVSLPTAAVITVAIVGGRLLIGKAPQYALQNKVNKIGPALKDAASKVQNAAVALKDYASALFSSCASKVKAAVTFEKKTIEEESRGLRDRLGNELPN